MKYATPERMIPESIVNTERCFWQQQTDFMRKNLRKAGELGSHLLLSLMANIVAVCGFIALVAMDKEIFHSSKIIIGIGFGFLGIFAVSRLIRLIMRGN